MERLGADEAPHDSKIDITGYRSTTSPSSEEQSHLTSKLVPQPSGDPRDPLNWSLSKKCSLFAIMCLAIFTGTATATSSLMDTTVQSKTFGRSPQTVSYTVTAAVAGLIIGPLILIPISSCIGSASTVFWCMIASAAFNIWSGSASDSDDFISYAVSRGLAGIFCQMPLILIPGFMINTFFLHQRGKAFTISSTLFTLATVMGPSFDGFIVQDLSWPNSFWWLVGGTGFAALLVFLFVEERAFNRTEFESATPKPEIEPSWIAGRLETFFPGTKVAPSGTSIGGLGASVKTSLLIALSPVTMLAGLFTMVNFAWNVALPIELSIFLQEPYKPDEDSFGYGLSARQTGLFYIALWLGMLSGQAYGVALNDRLPLYMWRRSSRSGTTTWRPEYRLHIAWIPGVMISVGIGLVGASLQNHYHFMVLALGSFFTTFGAPAAVSVSVNYAVETFKQHPQEVGAVMNVYRLALGFATPFAFEAWEASVGIGWIWGMMGFLSLAVFVLTLVPLMLYGEKLRSLSLINPHADAGDEGQDGMPMPSAGLGH